MKVQCAYCKRPMEISTGQYNYRVLKQGLKSFCNRKCFGLSRRKHRKKEDLVNEKWWYDAFYRLFNAEEIKIKKAAYFQKDYAANPEKYKAERQRKQVAHNEYCMQPAYRKKKKSYDRIHRCKKFYGEFGEAASVLIDLEKEIDSRAANLQNGTFNKSQKRKRQWLKIQAKTPLSSLLKT